MPRILGVDIPGKKRIEIALRYIYGIGPTRAMDIVKKVKIEPGTKADKLSDEHVAKITSILQSDYAVEGDLRRMVAQDIRRLVAIGSYRGTRHRRGLPVRGQRTKTNARTRKGKRQTVGAIRNKMERKVTGAETKSGKAAPVAAAATAAPAKAGATPAKAAPAPKK
jgi:small subunit ribosomal protein S13